MSQPPAYTPSHAFVSDSATLANFPGQQLDVEFNAVKATTDGIEANLKLIQRDDGALANGVVGYDALSGTVQANGLAPANPWATGTAYQIGNAVISSNTLYRCAIAHTATIFATDLAAGKWTLVLTLVYGAGTNISLAGAVISVVASPTFTAPNVTTLNGNTFTTGTYTLTGAAAKTLTFGNTLTLAGTDSTTITFQGTDTYVGRATTDTLTNKTIDTAGAGNVFSINGVAVTANTGTGAVARAVSPAFTTPSLGVATATSINGNTFTTGTYTLTGTAAKTLTFSNTLTLAGTDSTTITFQGTDTYVGRATTDTLTNKTFDTAGTGNVFKINGVAVSASTGTGSNVLATAPTISQPNLVGTTTNDSAAAGSVGEYIESVILTGAAVSLVSGTAKTVAGISLTAGDWDVSANLSTNGGGGVSITFVEASLSATTNAVDQSPGRNTQISQAANVPSTTPSHSLPVGPARFSLSAPGSVFLVANSNFTIGTFAGYGIIRARRIR